MHTRQSDRQALNILQEMSFGVGTSAKPQYRDASGSGASSSKQQAGGWSRDPTVIKPPGNPYNASTMRSDLHANTRTHASERAPTLQSTRTVLGLERVRPGDEYSSGRHPKRPRTNGPDPYLAPSHALRKRNSNVDGTAGKGKGRGGGGGGRGGKAAQSNRGGRNGPPPRNRSMLNLNADSHGNGNGETIVIDSEEEREDERKQKRKSSAKDDDHSSEGEVVMVSPHASPSNTPAPASHFDFSAPTDDGNSSDAFPATISNSKPTKAPSESYDDDEIDFIEPPRAGPSTSRVQAALKSAPDSGRALTRPASKPIPRRERSTNSEDVNVISSDEGEREVPPVKRMKTPTRTVMPSVKNLVNNIENNVSSSAPAPAPLKGKMLAKGSAPQWGSVQGGKVVQQEAKPLELRKDYSNLKISKTKTPAASDPVATAPTPFIRSAPAAPTSAPASTSGESKSTREENASSSRSRPAPTPIFAPSGSADDPETWLPLRYCAVGFKRLPIGRSEGEEFYVALTRKLQKLLVCRVSEGSSTLLLEIPLRKGQFEEATGACDKVLGKNSVPILQLRNFALANRISGSMGTYIDLNNGQGQNSLTLIFEPDHSMWTQRNYEKLYDHVNDIAKNMDKVNKPAATSILEHHEHKCHLFAQQETREMLPGPKASEKPPRLPRPMPQRVGRAKGSNVQTTLKSGMQQLTLTQPQPLRRSARNSGASNVPDHEPMPEADEVILVYPPSGRGSVNITNGDLGRLAPGDYLNDSLIEFGLKIWLDGLRETQPELAEQIHVFSSFFYKKLGSSIETGYASVRKWTSKINIFEKKYLVIPINENFHWYLAVIYEPGRVLQPPPPSHTRHSTRLKGDKPDINLADSQSSVVQPQDGAPSTDAATGQSDGHTRNFDAAPEALDESNTSRDMREEMDVEEVLNPVTGGNSPLSEPESEQDLTLLIPRSSSPEAPNDVEMEDISAQAGPSRAQSSCAETLDAPSTVDDVPDNNASKPPLQPSNGISGNGAVEASMFYAPAPPPAMRPNMKGKGKERGPVVDYLDFEDEVIPPHVESIDMTLNDSQPAEDDTPANPDEPPPAYVFTFDSLGGRHPAVGKKLGRYLHLEARDKMGKDIETLSPTSYFVAQVPTQPNSCDCGVYLLHFAKQFMQNAEDIVTYVTTKQARSKAKSVVPDEHWDPESVNHARAALRELIEEKSAVWKVDRQKEQERKEQEEKDAEAERAAAVTTGTGEGAEGAINIEDSDEDIQVLDGPSPPKGSRRKSAGGSHVMTSYGKKNKKKKLS